MLRSMPPMSKEQLETEAFNVLMGFDRRLLDTPMEVPIETIIEEYFGLQMEYQILSLEEDNILGLTAFTDGVLKVYDSESLQEKFIAVSAGTIIIDERLVTDSRKVGRYRFTCGHETSHWHLHRHGYIDDGQGSLFGNEELNAIVCLGRNIESKWGSSRRRTPQEWIEWQADYMASALLMPEIAFKTAFYESTRNFGIYDECIVYDISDQSAASKTLVACIDHINGLMAGTFRVSKQAARIRMSNLGLIKAYDPNELFA